MYEYYVVSTSKHTLHSYFLFKQKKRNNSYNVELKRILIIKHFKLSTVRYTFKRASLMKWLANWIGCNMQNVHVAQNCLIVTKTRNVFIMQCSLFIIIMYNVFLVIIFYCVCKDIIIMEKEFQKGRFPKL